MANVLFLTSHLPFPPLSGGRRREYELLRRLSTKHDIEICAVTRTFEFDQAHQSFVQAFARVNLFRCSPNVDERPNLRGESFLVRRNASLRAAKFIASLLADGGIDLIHCEGYYMRCLVDDQPVPVFVMEQNIEYLAWPDSMDQIRAEEVGVWRSSIRCAAVTEEDAGVIRKVVGSERVFVSFNGCDHPTALGAKEIPRVESWPTGPIVLYIGNFAYGPSYEAGATMCTVIGPKILNRVPEATIVLVGNESQRIVPLIQHARCVVHGRVPSLEPYYAAATVVGFPLSRGRGISVKVTEALARGCAIVTTEVGQRGLADAPLVVAGDSEEFAIEVTRLLLNPEDRNKLRRRAAVYGAKLPTWDAAARRLNECWEQAIRAGRTISDDVLLRRESAV